MGAVRSSYGDLLDDREIDLNEDPDDSVEWAIDDLKASFVFKESQSVNKRFAAAMSEADMQDRVDVVAEFATEMVALSMKMENKESKVDAREGIATRLQAYEARAADRDSVYGLRLGLAEVDAYTRGIHPGELAVAAAGPKVGKSYLLGRCGLSEWQANRTAVLYTLENSVEMTLDRIACLATGIDSRSWLHGTCEPEEVEAVRTWIEAMVDWETPLHIIQPEPGQRSVEAMVRQAQLLDADSILLDQLTFIEPQDERAPRHLQIREITHNLKTMISTGRGRMSCLLAHQINREGVKAADKSGMLEMYHLAEGSEVERTADWVFGLYRSVAERSLNQIKFQTLAARREDTRNYQLRWNINVGLQSVMHEIDGEGNWVNPLNGAAT